MKTQENMEADVSQDFQDYWNEYRIIQETKILDDYLDEEYGSRDEGEAEAEWLVSAGLGQLAEPFLAGREIAEGDLSPALTVMSEQQAEAIRRRVNSLNHTVRQRGRQNRARNRKPDIRDVFRDVESWSTGSRSRSATPDSLDSTPPSPPLPWPPRLYHEPETEPEGNNLSTTPPPSFVQIFEEPQSIQVRRNESRREVQRAPNSYQGSVQTSTTPHTRLFRSASRAGADIVASETADGIQMLGYQRIGSIRYTGGQDRSRSSSDPVRLTSAAQDNHDLITTPRDDRNEGLIQNGDSLYNRERRHGGSNVQNSSAAVCTLGFEEMCSRGDSVECNSMEDPSWYEETIGKTWVDWLAEEDLVKLRPLLFVELTVMMDNNGVRFNKQKPHKRKRKEDSCLFGSCLAALLERDQQITSDPHNVPLIFQKVLGELERRGLCEEGILRVAAHKQKVEALCDALEKEFYTKPEKADALLQKAPIHDLATLLKRLLRDLPESILTNELLELFYQAHGLQDCVRALNLLVLLLPCANRATLHALITFLRHVIANQAHNKMSLHNVAMIIAPSLFPPRYLSGEKGTGSLKAQIGFAAVCCRLTEMLLQCGDSLFLVPPVLLSQLRHLYEEQRYKLKENKPIKRFLGKRGRNIMRKIDNEVDFQDGVIRVTAPMFLLAEVPVTLTPTTTAGDVILRLVELASEETAHTPTNVKIGRKDIKSRALSELAPNGNLSCLLSTADPETALQTHFLHEVGGNIAQRRIEPSALMLAVYQENPNAQWIICCDHRKGSSRAPFLHK